MSYERNKDIIRRHLAGELHTSIARDYRISRERVRQIATRGTGKPRRDQNRAQKADSAQKIIDALETQWLTGPEAAKKLGVSKNLVQRIARENKIEVPRRSFSREMKLKFAAAKVRSGVSIMRAAREAGIKPNGLEYYCKQHGIVSTARSRHQDLSHREPLLREWRMANKTWAECVRLLAEHEGRQLTSVHVWVKTHHPYLLDIAISRPAMERKPRVQRGPRAPRVPRSAKVVLPDPAIEVRETIRETAIANRGKASAAQIARAIGVTRNSIIGYWFRSRQEARA